MPGALIANLVIGWLCATAYATGMDRKNLEGGTPWAVTVTAYCPCKKCCGRHADGRTASGIRARGKIVAAPRSIPFGTVIFVPGYGVASVQDRGRSIRGNRLDVLFRTHAEAVRYGRRKMTVLVRLPGSRRQPRWPVARSQARRPQRRPRYEAGPKRPPLVYRRHRDPRPARRRPGHVLRTPGRGGPSYRTDHEKRLSDLIQWVLREGRVDPVSVAVRVVEGHALHIDLLFGAEAVLSDQYYNATWPAGEW